MITKVSCSTRADHHQNSEPMPITLDVENQRFAFGGNWTEAFKYDDTNYYRNGPERLKGDITTVEQPSQAVSIVPQSTRAVDVVALHNANGLLFLEAKDFRGHQIENKDRIQRGELPVEVALKVRDTLAGLVGADRRHTNEFNSHDLIEAMHPDKQVTVVLWLEDDMLWQDARRSKQHLQAVNDALKQKLAWLGVRSFVLSSQVPNRLSDLQVTNLAGAGQPNP